MASQQEVYKKSMGMMASLMRQLDLSVENAEAEKERALEARVRIGRRMRE